jgi:hypothetical protein
VSPSTGETKKERSAGSSFVELIVIVVVALGLALGIQAFLVKPYRIPSESMVPTLQIGQRVLVNRLGNRFNKPDIGEVVVFHPPAGSDTNTCGDPDKKSDQPCDQVQGQLHQARRGWSGRHGVHQGRPRLRQWQAPGRRLHAAVPGRDRLRLHAADHHSAGPLVHDG